jgi:hypothetical protein
MYVVVAIAAIFWMSGCGPTLTAQSSPPPGRIAALDSNDDKYDLDISSGVAIAISCYDDGPCKNVVVSTEDESIAAVKGAAFGAIDKSQQPYPHNAVYSGTYAHSGVVIIGKKPGNTKVKIKTSDGSRTINVTVVAPPASGTASTIAAP